MSNKLLEIKNLHVNVEDKEILKGIDLTINKGEIHVIMGPNGSGKTTTANAILSNPLYNKVEGNINFESEDITNLKTDEIARKGVFMSFQLPEEIPGISVTNFLKSAKGKITGKPIKVFEFKDELRKYMEELKMNPEYAERSLNVGFSGGEKKKNEILQMLVLNPKLAILDETDSGLDVDAIRTVSKGIEMFKNENNAVLIITHNTKILKSLKVDYVHILVNGKNAKVSYKIQENDKISVEIPEPKQIELKAQNIPIEIIYEDSDIIVVNKPKGMVVHPANGNPDGTLVNAIMAICKDSLSGIGGEIRPGIVHRIDKDTSGLLIVAKNDNAHVKMSEQIKNHEVKKTYIALVRGVFKENEATIDMPIGRSTSDRKKMAVNKNGKNAITHIKVLKRFDKYTLLKVNIETGRTHQIRVHLSHIGYPIVGDYTYSNGKNEFDVIGQCLHAQKLEFKHPITQKDMCLEAELPQYFKDILDKLKDREIK